MVLMSYLAAVFFILMLYRFFTSESFRLELSSVKGNPLAKWFELRHFSPLLYLLLRDGIVYFAMYVLHTLVPALQQGADYADRHSAPSQDIL